MSVRPQLIVIATLLFAWGVVADAQAAPAKGDLQPTYTVGKIKHRYGRYWTPVTLRTPTPPGIGPQMACNGRATATVRMKRKRVEATFGALTPTGISDCEATAIFKLKQMPKRGKKYKMTLSFPGNEAFNPYKGSTKLVLRR